MNRALSALVGTLLLCGTSTLLRAQAAESRDRWALGLAADVGEMPETMSDHCGSVGDDPVPMLGGGFSVVFAPRSWLIVAADSRISGTAPTGCALNVPAPTYLGNGQWESAASRDDGAMPKPPLMRSALRVGLQTPERLPLLRATVGGGVLWGTSAPFGVATIGIGTRGRHVRFYGELEGGVARLRIFEESTIYHVDASGAPVLDSRTTTPEVTHPHWVMAHIGLEVPFASK